MILKKDNIELTCLEIDIVEQRLDLDGKHILELGCGQGDLTRRIAGQGNDRRLVATEVDEQQHAINITNNKLPNVRFELAGAQAIPASDETFDRVLMFKSLHHVPVGVIQAALLEIKRVLKPGGLLYISEPLFQGDFNEVLRLFHDEERVRAAAFNAITATVRAGNFTLQEQLFFRSSVFMPTFSMFEQSVINVTHTDHQITAAMMKAVKVAFEKAVAVNGGVFTTDNRVDLLRKQSRNRAECIES